MRSVGFTAFRSFVSHIPRPWAPASGLIMKVFTFDRFAA